MSERREIICLIHEIFQGVFGQRNNLSKNTVVNEIFNFKNLIFQCNTTMPESESVGLPPPIDSVFVKRL